jgi:hypothetical protein
MYPRYFAESISMPKLRSLHIPSKLANLNHDPIKKKDKETTVELPTLLPFTFEWILILTEGSMPSDYPNR